MTFWWMNAQKRQQKSCSFCTAPSWKPGWKMLSNSMWRSCSISFPVKAPISRDLAKLQEESVSPQLLALMALIIFYPLGSWRVIPTFQLFSPDWCFSPRCNLFFLLGDRAIPCLGVLLSHWEKHFDWLLSAFWIIDLNLFDRCLSLLLEFFLLLSFIWTSQVVCQLYLPFPLWFARIYDRKNWSKLEQINVKKKVLHLYFCN